MSQSTFAALVAAFLVSVCAVTGAAAQTTGSVFGPVVREGHRSIEYRTAFNPDTNAFAQRLHYQQSIDSSFRWRILVQARKTSSSEVDFDFVQGELLWDLTKDDTKTWQTAVRFDARIRDGGRPGAIGVHWVNQFLLSDEWRARILLLTAFNVGEGSFDGGRLQTRANIYRSFPNRYSVGLEMFSGYGTTSDFADFDEQQHRVGPFAVIPVGVDGWKMFAGALFGLTDSTPDTELRLWLARSF